jgi:flagellin-specific chaperone FliS
LHSNEVKEIDNFIQLMTPMLDQEEIDTELFILYYFYLMKLMEAANNKMNS